MIIKLHPVVAAAGIPLFGGDFAPEQYDLADTHVFNSGVMHLTYTKP